MNTKTRLKLTIIGGVFLAGMTLVATILKMENIATTSLAGLMTIFSTYIWSQTKRPSQQKQNATDTDNS